MTETVRTTQHRRFEGQVVSAKEQKTVHVLVHTTKVHPKYRKQYRQSRKFAIHDEHGKAKVGDVVLFEECRPLSRTKRWTLVEVLRKA